MKVWVVTWFSAEQYTDYTGVDSVWSSLEAATKYVEDNSCVLGADPDNYDEGYFLSEIITEHEVQ